MNKTVYNKTEISSVRQCLRYKWHHFITLPLKIFGKQIRLRSIWMRQKTQIILIQVYNNFVEATYWRIIFPKFLRASHITAQSFIKRIETEGYFLVENRSKVSSVCSSLMTDQSWELSVIPMNSHTILTSKRDTWYMNNYLHKMTTSSLFQDT